MSEVRFNADRVCAKEMKQRSVGRPRNERESPYSQEQLHAHVDGGILSLFKASLPQDKRLYEAIEEALCLYVAVSSPKALVDVPSKKPALKEAAARAYKRAELIASRSVSAGATPAP